MKQKKLRKLLDQHQQYPIHHVVAEIAVHAKNTAQASDHVIDLLSDDASLTPWLAFATAHVQEDERSYEDLLKENARLRDELQWQLTKPSESESEREIDYSALPPWQDGPLVKLMSEAVANGETVVFEEASTWPVPQFTGMTEPEMDEILTAQHAEVEAFRAYYRDKAKRLAAADLEFWPAMYPNRFQIRRDRDFEARAEGIPVGVYAWSLTCEVAPFEYWDARSLDEAISLVPAFCAYLSEGTFVRDSFGWDWHAPETSGYEIYVRGTQETPDHG